MAAKIIYGLDLGSLKGKTVRRKADHVRAIVTDLPCLIYELYKDVTVCADLMKVNGGGWWRRYGTGNDKCETLAKSRGLLRMVGGRGAKG
jgi:hypothetical protein